VVTIATTSRMSLPVIGYRYSYTKYCATIAYPSNLAAKILSKTPPDFVAALRLVIYKLPLIQSYDLLRHLAMQALRSALYPQLQVLRDLKRGTEC